MERTTHIFEDGYYHIWNKSVSKSFMFKDEQDFERFKTNIRKYLDPICDIMAYNLLNEEFQLVLRMKSREIIEEYFMEKHTKQYEKLGIIPETTYIFARAMANMQSAYVKWFNFKYSRDGGLMGSRYGRMLIESEDQMRSIIKDVHNLKKKNNREFVWRYKEGDGFRIVMCKKDRSSRHIYEGEGLNNGDENWVKHVDYIYVRGHFENLPPKRLEFNSEQEKMKNLRFCFRF